METLFLVITSIFLGIGMYLIYHDYARTKYGYQTRGRVIQLKGEWGYGGNSTSHLYYPIVRFYSEGKQELQRRLEVGFSIPLFSKGQDLKIIYYNDKAYPAGTMWKLLYWCIFLISLGAAIIQLYYW
ncbi:DUF3592 domain-containing protein [Rufibacter tibetensis]|nr:DUF3592 domain-containing protein [Rufibacter tibetensis]